MSRILTFVDLAGRTVAVGDAYFTLRRGRLTATFCYDRDYVALHGAYAVDPALGLSTVSWPLPHGLPGAFSDAAPDRWGRNLIARRLRFGAGAAGRATPTLDDRDYLLGVSDETRQTPTDGASSRGRKPLSTWRRRRGSSCHGPG